MMRYFLSALWHFLVFFVIGFICMMIMQLFNAALTWYGNGPPYPISFWLSVKLAFPPSLVYGLYGIYKEWDVIHQSKMPPPKRHPHD